MGSLSREQIEHYEEHGYVVVPGVLSGEDMQRYRERARAISLGDVPEEARNRVVQDIAYAKGQLPVPKDALYFPFEPHDRCVGVWIPLDPVGEANGTLTVVPGSQKMKVQRHGFRDGINFGALAAEGIEGNAEFHERAVALDLPPGDCVLFATRTLHRTGGNRTNGHRRVITLHMASARCRPTSDTRLDEYGFTSVRGDTFEGCLQPLERPSLQLATGRGRRMDRA